MLKHVIIFAALCLTAYAQTPSGLLNGPVTYGSTLTSGNPYGDRRVWLVRNPDGTIYNCAANVANVPSCYIVKGIVVSYGNLQASDGTSDGIPNCYTWDASQLILNDSGYCQTSFHGGGSGETRVGIYCPNSVSFDINGTYALNAAGCNFGGTAITEIDGANVPIATLFTVNVTITHHPVSVWIAAYFRTPAHWETWQQIDSSLVTVTPQN